MAENFEAKEIDNSNLERWGSLSVEIDAIEGQLEAARDSLAKLSADIKAIVETGDKTFSHTTAVEQRYAARNAIKGLETTLQSLHEEYRQLTTALNAKTEPDEA